MADAAAPASEAPKKKKKIILIAAITLGVVLIQGGAFFAFMKFMGGGPATTHAAPSEEHGAAAAPANPASPAEETGSAEVVLLQRFKVPNNKSGALIIYDFDISVVVVAGRKAHFEEVLKARVAEISDRVAQAIRTAPARVFGEDDLGTLRRLVKGTLSEILGDEETIQRVLIPRCVPLRTE